MKNILALLVFIFAFSTPAISKEINFEFKHSLRIPYYKVEISIEEIGNEYIMYVYSSPMEVELEKQHEETIKDYIEESRKNYSRKIPKESVEDLYNSILEFQKSFIPIQPEYSYTDGTTWSLSIGSSIDKIKIVSRSPQHDTEKRKLKKFVSICETIVEMSGLSIKKVLYD